MIYRWYQVARQSAPKSDEPWVCMEIRFSEFNGTTQHTVMARRKTEAEAKSDCWAFQELMADS